MPKIDDFSDPSPYSKSLLFSAFGLTSCNNVIIDRFLSVQGSLNWNFFFLHNQQKFYDWPKKLISAAVIIILLRFKVTFFKSPPRFRLLVQLYFVCIINSWIGNLQIKESNKKIEAWIFPMNPNLKPIVICSISHFCTTVTVDGKYRSTTVPLDVMF